MFEDYIQDSSDFFLKAKQKARESEEREAKRYYRASIFYALGAMEAFVNYHAESFAQAGSMARYEICFLNDKVLYFKKNKGFIEKTEFHKLDHKIRLLMYKFVPRFDFGGKTWNYFIEFKKFRDTLVHPRDTEDETMLNEYNNIIRDGLKAIIEIMNQLSEGMFGRPIRKNLLDCIPE